MNNAKEYGGYLPLELSKKQHHYQSNKKYKVLSLNSGRAAILCAIEDFNPTRIYIPFYNCHTVSDVIISKGIKYQYYYLDSELMPINVDIKKREMLLWINYFGNSSNGVINEVVQKYVNVIIDNAQGFFAEPMVDAYNCYSVRKFFGVCDGAYLIKGEFNKDFVLDSDVSYPRALHLFKSIELGTNAAYKENLDNESAIGNDILSMSKLTTAICSSIDYDKVIDTRKANMLMLNGYLSEFNEFNVNLTSNTHLYYPFLYTKKKLREHLVGKKIYIPTCWKHVPEKCNYSEIEVKLTKYLNLLPIDQRYTTKDMSNIADIVMYHISKG